MLFFEHNLPKPSSRASGLKSGKGFRKRAAHPHSTFLEVPPGLFRRMLDTNGWEVIVPGVPCGDRGNWD